MLLIEIKNDIEFELSLLDRIVSETNKILIEVANSEASIIYISSSALFLAQYYNGIENILKRICKYKDLVLPYSENSHIELFKWFCENSNKNLPLLFTSELKEGFSILRRFRHYVFHGYAFYLEWDKLRIGMKDLEHLNTLFKIKIIEYLNTLV